MSYQYQSIKYEAEKMSTGDLLELVLDKNNTNPDYVPVYENALRQRLNGLDELLKVKYDLLDAVKKMHSHDDNYY